MKQARLGEKTMTMERARHSEKSISGKRAIH